MEFRLREKRKHHRFDVVGCIKEDVMMHFSPPLIQDPIKVTVLEISAGGMKVETDVPIPRRFFFKIAFTPSSIRKISAEGKVVRVIKEDQKFIVGVKFVKIDSDVAGTINEIASDVKECLDRFVDGVKPVCIRDCKYFSICKKKEKIPQKV